MQNETQVDGEAYKNRLWFIDYACARIDLPCVYVLVYALPAPVFPISYGYKGLEVSSLQAVLQQLLGRVNILRDTLDTLVQHPWALADLALGVM